MFLKNESIRAVNMGTQQLQLAWSTGTQQGTAGTQEKSGPRDPIYGLLLAAPSARFHGRSVQPGYTSAGLCICVFINLTFSSCSHGLWDDALEPYRIFLAVAVNSFS